MVTNTMVTMIIGYAGYYGYWLLSYHSGKGLITDCTSSTVDFEVIITRLISLLEHPDYILRFKTHFLTYRNYDN